MQEESGETVCSDSNVVAAWLCPLCQQGQPDRASLSLHLTDRHSVLPTCVDKLLDIAIPKQWASEEDRDTDVQNDTDAASLQLKHIEASDSPSEVCQHDESVELPQQSGDKVKEMDEEQEGIKEQEGDGVYLQSDQEGSGKTETPDNSEKNTSNNGVVAESDDSRPFKCNACIEAFPTRTALSVHYNSVSHMQRMRTGSSKQGGESETPTPSVPVLSRPYLSNKPYQCAVCRVSYNHAITLESHMKSVLHQTRSRNAGNAANSTARSTGSGSSNMAPNVVVTSSGGGATISNCATPCSLASVTTKDGELIQTPALAPSLLTSPVASAQAVSAFLTLLTSSPNSLSHSLLPTLFATGASPGVATPRLIPQPQMLMPLILNGLQTQSQSPTLESPSQLLTQSVPLLGLSAAQQALLVQRLSSLQNQWPAVGLAATIQTNSQDTKDDVKSEVVKEETEEKGLVKGEGENLTMPVGNGKQEIKEEQESKGYAQELKTESEKNRDGDCRKNGDNEMADREGCTTDGRNPVDQREAEEEGGDFDKVAQPNLTNSPIATDKSIACDYRSPSVSLHSNSSLSPVNLHLTLSPDSTPQKPSPFKCALDSPDQIRPRPNLRGRHRSTGSLILTEFQSQVLWAFLESRSEADAASPPREDCEALGREVGLAEGEVRRWLGDAHNAKERQKARGAALMRSIAGYGRNVWGLENDNNNDDDDEEESALTIVEGEDNAEASGSQAMDLSSSGGRRRERDLGRESIGDPCLTSDSDNEESYTSVIVSDEDSQSGSVREGPGSPTREEVQGELAGDKGTGGGKVLRSTTVFLSDAEDEEEEGGAQRAKRKKRKRELEREEVEAKKERQDPDMDLELEAQADPPGPLPLSIDHLGHPSGILHSLPLSLSLAPFSTQFLSPYVLSLPPSVVGMGVAEGDGGKVPAFPNPPTITRFSDPLLTPPISSHTHISRFLSNGGECESALDLSIGKNRSSTSASSTSATKDKTSVQKGRLLDGLGLRPTAGGLIVVQVKPDSASATPTSNSGGYVNCNNMAKASTVYMRAAERLNATLMERERERAKEKERQKEKEEREKAQKRPSIRGKRYRDMRRSRTIIQAEQLDVLYGCYFKDANPGKHEFEQISEWVHLPKKVVQIWFQNMRARERKGEVRFISDGTLAAVGKPLIKFTWPLSKPIFSSTPKSNTNTTNSNSLTTASTAATSARLLPKTEKEQVKEKETVKIPNPVPNRPKEVASCTVSSSSSTSASAVPKTKLETTNNVTMVKIAPKITAPVLPVTPKETLPTPPRPPQKRKHEEVSREAAYTDEEEDDRNEERFVPGIINRMVPKLSPTPITKCPAAVSQKQNGLNYWSPKGPFKINTLSREQLGLSTTPRTITPAPTPTITPAAATTTTTTTTASPASAGLVNTTTVSMAKSAPTEASFLNHSTSRRPRTHLSCLQLSILQSCYETCAHPNALECEAIGTELGLPLKVVQIWFQNTRAKEKRWRLQQEKLSPSSSEPSKKVDVSSGSYLQYNALRANRPILPKPVQLTVLEPSVPPAAGQPAGRETLRGRCEACNVGFESRAAARAHVFSPRHLATLRTTNFGQPATLANNGSGTGSGVEAIESSPPPASSTS